MPEPILAALRRLSEARGYTSPDVILGAWSARHGRRRPFLIWWRER
jgi:hypothetical protein